MYVLIKDHFVEAVVRDVNKRATGSNIIPQKELLTPGLWDRYNNIKTIFGSLNGSDYRGLAGVPVNKDVISRFIEDTYGVLAKQEYHKDGVAVFDMDGHYDLFMTVYFRTQDKDDELTPVKKARLRRLAQQKLESAKTSIP